MYLSFSYVFVCKEPFVCQKRFDCIPESLITPETFAGNVIEVTLFCKFVWLLHVFFAFLCSKKFSLDGSSIYLFLSLDLFMIALLSCFVIKGPLISSYHFLRGICLSKTEMSTSENVEYMSLLHLKNPP